MKKIAFLSVFIIVTLSYQSCSSNNDDDDDNDEPKIEFAGEWSGSYTGDLNGIWTANISNEGIVNGTVTTSTGQSGSLSGTVRANGLFTATAGSTTGGSDFIGNLSGDIATGTWKDRTSDLHGTWEGER